MPDPIIIECPHCSQMCEVVELNCRIFRCGIYKNNFQQIPPHLPEKDCNELKTKDLIFGCGKPFQAVDDVSNNTIVCIICDYI